MADVRPYADEVSLVRPYADQVSPVRPDANMAGFERRQENLLVALDLITEWPDLDLVAEPETWKPHTFRDIFALLLGRAAIRLEFEGREDEAEIQRRQREYASEVSKRAAARRDEA